MLNKFTPQFKAFVVIVLALIALGGLFLRTIKNEQAVTKISSDFKSFVQTEKTKFVTPTMTATPTASPTAAIKLFRPAVKVVSPTTVPTK